MLNIVPICFFVVFLIFLICQDTVFLYFTFFFAYLSVSGKLRVLRNFAKYCLAQSSAAYKNIII